MLSFDDYLNINNHVRYHRMRLEALQLCVNLSNDVDRFLDARLKFPGFVYIHPTLDPNETAFGPEDFFWVWVESSDGTMVSCAATRKYDQASLPDLFMSRRVWHSERPSIDDQEPVEIDWPEQYLNAQGTLAIHGGLVTHPKFGERGIGTHLIRLVRAASLRAWMQDYNFGFIRSDIEKRGFQKRRYGYPWTCKAFVERPDDGLPGPRYDVEYLNLITQEQMLAEYAMSPENLGL